MFDTDTCEYGLVEPLLTDTELEVLTVTEEKRAAAESTAVPVLDAELLGWLPRPFLALVLTTLDRSHLTGHDRVHLLNADARMRSMVDADIYHGIAAIHDDEATMLGPDTGPDEAFELTSGEVAAALSLTRRSADRETRFALDLADHPLVLTALAAGDIDYRRARIIIFHVTGLSERAALTVLEAILPQAGALTTGQLGHRLARLAIQADPVWSRARYLEGVESRRVWTETNPDGTLELGGANLPVDRAREAANRIHELARSLKTADETRTLDQIKADVFLDLICGHHVGSQPTHGGSVHVIVELETLAGLADRAGELDATPVIGEIARKTTARQTDCDWTFLVTHNGAPVSTGTLSRRPTTAQAHHIRAAYPRCVFPGCRMPARHSDLDHRTPWSERGPTQIDNLAPLCRHHHRLKHQGWKLERDRTGAHTWTSPLGHIYTTGPDPP